MQTLHLTFSDVSGSDDWKIVANFSNLTFPDAPVTAEQCEQWAAENPQHVFTRRQIARQDDQPMAALRVIEPFWTASPGLVDVRVYIEYAEANAPLFETMMRHCAALAKEREFHTLRTWNCSTNVAFESVLRRLGLSPGQRNAEVKLDLATFDPAPFADNARRVSETGYTFLSLPEFRASRPETWMRDYWRLEQDIMADVPLPDPWEEIPFETYEKMILSPTFRPEGYFIALHGDALAATTQLNWNFVDETLAHTGITGTRREHRRKGLATALKVHSIEWARSVGIERVMTDNEEKNPMLDINVALGFAQAYEWVEWTGPIA